MDVALAVHVTVVVEDGGLVEHLGLVLQAVGHHAVAAANSGCGGARFCDVAIKCETRETCALKRFDIDFLSLVLDYRRLCFLNLAHNSFWSAS